MDPYDLKMFVTLWPSLSHFADFAHDNRLSGIRLNSAMIDIFELDDELTILKFIDPSVPMYFDVKGRQLRVESTIDEPGNFRLRINHSISVPTPTEVLFKAGTDWAPLKEITNDGKTLIFESGPKFIVRPGESIHLRHPKLKVSGATFTQFELAKIEKVKKFGFSKYFLSYVDSQRSVDEFLDLVGKDSEVYLKIESKPGLEYVAREFKKQDNLILVAARGDLYVEIDKPHQIIKALKAIIEKDPEACVGSRILLSTLRDPVPECSDFLELAWLYDIGYRSMMLCDEICLNGDLLDTAMNAFDAFRDEYTKK